MQAPFFSVVVPTCNRAGLLSEAIRSVLAQSFKDFELIIVDDHSTDRTKTVVEEINDWRIFYVLNDHGKGGAGTRNAGIMRARGQWTAFLDDDDLWLPEKLARLHARVQDIDEKVGLIYTGCNVINLEDKERVLQSIIPEKQGWLHEDILYSNFIGTFSTVALRTDLLKSVGGLDERFSSMQDLELYARVSQTAKIACIPEILSCIRLGHSDRISTSVEKKLAGSILFWEKHKAEINSTNRLRHRAASRVFKFALQKGDLTAGLKTLPWTLSGLLFDHSNLISVLRSIISFHYRKLSGPPSTLSGLPKKADG